MTGTCEDVADGLDFVTTVHRPHLPDLHLGFGFQHQAERACWKLKSDLTNTTHAEGTTISWSHRPEGVTVLAPLPTDSWMLDELIKEEGYTGEPDEFPDLCSRLNAQEGDDDGGRIWSAACSQVDRDALTMPRQSLAATSSTSSKAPAEV